MSELIVQNLCKKFKNTEILKNISFTAERGDCIGLLGVNGSGKSTLLSILAKITKPSSGNVSISSFGYVPQQNPLIEELSVYDNLLLWYSKKDLKNQLQSGLINKLELDDFLKTKVHKLSGGQKKRVSIACAVCNSPQVLLLDEPSAALDLICKEKIISYYREFIKSGGTILMATHDIQEIELCNRWFVIKTAKLIPYQYNRKEEICRFLENT